MRANLFRRKLCLYLLLYCNPAQSAATSRASGLRYRERYDEKLDLVGLALANAAGVTLAGVYAPAALGDASLAGSPPQAGLLACLYGDWHSGFSAVRGTPASASRRQSRCSAAGANRRQESDTAEWTIVNFGHIGCDVALYIPTGSENSFAQWPSLEMLSLMGIKDSSKWRARAIKSSKGGLI
jgi:hypothetical protein